jgi:hypothetical protein
MKQMDDKMLEHFCRSDPNIARLCRDDSLTGNRFWQDRYEGSFGEYNEDTRRASSNWKNRYLSEKLGGERGLLGPMNGDYMYLVHHNMYEPHQGIWVNKNIYDAIVDNESLLSENEDYLENPDRLGDYYNIEPLVDNDLFSGVYSLGVVQADTQGWNSDVLYIDGIDGILPILPLYDLVFPKYQIFDQEFEYMISMEYKKFEQNPALYRAAMKKYYEKLR